MSGTVYGVGVGPGDPELMTLKAVRLIREKQVIALPGAEAEETAAYKIAVQAVPELREKELLSLHMPMTHDREEMKRCHREAARKMEEYLEEEKDVVFLTLGDPTVYSTFFYLQEILKEDGYKTATVSGIPSFCAAAARLNIPLVTWNEELHVLPTAHRLKEELPKKGTCVLMKSGKKMEQVKEKLAKDGRKAAMVENCGMDQEKVYRTLEEIPEDAGYYSLIISK